MKALEMKLIKLIARRATLVMVSAERSYLTAQISNLRAILRLMKLDKDNDVKVKEAKARDKAVWAKEVKKLQSHLLR